MSEESNQILDFDAIVEATNAKHGTNYKSLKSKQQEALDAAFTGDTICVLPTGYGKTVIIHLLPYLIPANPPTAIIVVAPLNAILLEQKSRFGEFSLLLTEALVIELEALKKRESKSTLSDDDQETAEPPSADLQRLLSGNFSFLLSHPEQITNAEVRKVLMTDEVSPKISHIVIDEGHCMLSWGKSKFRPAFLELKRLRITIPNAHFLILTATATPKAIEEFKDELCLRTHTIVKASPDRPAIYIDVRMRPPDTGGSYDVENSYNYCVDPILDDLCQKKKECPRTIMYMPLNWCGHVHERALLRLLSECDEHQLIQPTNSKHITSYVAQFHAPQTAEMKELISETMQMPDSPLRVLLATEAYGMGADSPNVRRVVHVGPPNSLETYIQEMGRCARDGEPGEAVLFYNHSDIANNKDHMTDAMIEFCKLTTCRREYLMKYFGFNATPVHGRCCDVCSGTQHITQFSTPRVVPNVPIANTLNKYFIRENAVVTSNLLPHLSTGLCLSLAKQISASAQRYAFGDSLKEDYRFLDDHYIHNIQAILQFCLVD